MNTYPKCKATHDCNEFRHFMNLEVITLTFGLYILFLDIGQAIICRLINKQIFHQLQIKMITTHLKTVRKSTIK